MDEVFWRYSVNFGSVALSAVLLVLSIWFSSKMLRRNGVSLVLILSESARFLAVLMLVVMILMLERVQMLDVSRDPEIAVLYDVSGSMATKDVADSAADFVSRKEWVQGRVDEVFWKPLETRYRVFPQSFPEAAPDDGTDINMALEDLISRRPGLRAVVLLTDGEWNTGVSPVSAAVKLRLNGTRIYSVGVGSERYLPDIELQEISAPAYALAGEHLAVPFVVQSRLAREVRTEIIVRSAGETVVRKPIVIPPHGVVRDTVVIVPQIQGERKYIASVPVQDEEWLADNNEKSFDLSVRLEKLKVLILESRPRWEYRFMRNALMRDPAIDCRVLLLHEGLESASGDGYVSSFPSTRSEIADYDVIFLGDVGIAPGVFEETHAEMIKGLVEQHGSGLVFLPGLTGRHMSFKGSVLEEMLPVVLDERVEKGYGSDIEATIQLTQRGTGHRLTMLENNPGLNSALWRSLPGFYWYAPVLRAKSGSEVLGVHSQARTAEGRVPLLVIRQYGRGKILYMATDSAWRWRRGVEDKYHYKFWGQVVRWMAHQRHLARGDGARLAFSPESPSAGERVYLHATVMDKTGYPLQSGVVKATVTAPDGTSRQIELMPEAGGWGLYAGNYTPSSAGDYTVDVSADSEGSRASAKLTVRTMQRERVGRPVNAGVLKEIAAITGGAYAGAVDLASIVDKVAVMPEAEPVQKIFRLWSHPAWCAVLVMLLGVHWILRKLMGLV